MSLYIAVNRDNSEIVALAESRSWFTHGDHGDDTGKYEAVAAAEAQIDVYAARYADFASGRAFIGGSFDGALGHEADRGKPPIAHLALKP